MNDNDGNTPNPPQKPSCTDDVRTSLPTSENQKFVIPLTIANKTFQEGLNLEYLQLDGPLEIKNCTVRKSLNLRSSKLDQLIITDSEINTIDVQNTEIKGDFQLAGCTIGDGNTAAINAKSAQIDGNLIATTGTAKSRTQFNGELNFELARIAGRLDLNHCEIDGSARPFLSGRIETVALSLVRATCKGGVRLRGATIHGQIRAIGLASEAQINLNGIELHNPGSKALVLERCDSQASIMARSATISGRVSFLGATVKGNIDLSRSTIAAELDSVALDISSVSCSSVRLDKGELKSRPTNALWAPNDNVTIKGRVEIKSSLIGKDLHIDKLIVTSRGNTLTLDSTRISGRIHASGLKLRNFGKAAPDTEESATLVTRGISVSQDCNFKGSTFRGGLLMKNVRIGSYLSFESCRFPLHGSQISLQGSKIGTDLNFANAIFHSRSCDFTGVTISGSFIWKSVKGSSSIVLDSAFAHEIDDDFESWKTVNPLNLEGFSFDQFGTSAFTKEECNRRIAWTNQNSSSTAGPLKELASYYSNSSCPELERMVMLDYHRRQVRSLKRGPRKVGHWILFALTGNGYRVIGLALISICVILFAIGAGCIAQGQDLVNPVPENLSTTSSSMPLRTEGETSDSDMHLGESDMHLGEGGAPSNTAGVGPNECDENYHCFSPILWGFDIVVPASDLSQERYWIPDRSTASGRALDYTISLLKGIGWLVLTVIISEIFRRFQR